MAFDVQAEARAQDARRRRALPVVPASSAALSDAAGRRRSRSLQQAAAKATRMVMLIGAVIVALIAWSLIVQPIGTSVLMLAVLATAAALIGLGVFPRARDPQPATIASAPPTRLPAVTDAWLDRRRKALPALAAPQIDAISARLATLEPQLASVAANDPVAADLNRLLGQHLPELVERYTRVPAELRRKPGPDGESIETRLVEGLGVVETELARVSEQLAQGDREAFLIQGRFLESRYGNDEIK